MNEELELDDLGGLSNFLMLINEWDAGSVIFGKGKEFVMG